MSDGGDVPFDVLMVCMGNICRSPMAERLLAARLAAALGPVAEGLVRVHSAGTGAWHVGDPMQAPAARQVRARGGDPDGFRARALRSPLAARADLVLTATVEQVAVVAERSAPAAARTFVLGEFARLAAAVDPGALPPSAPTPTAVAARGRALVAAVDARRDGVRPDDEVPDPYGEDDAYYTEVADRVDAAVTSLAALLVPGDGAGRAPA